MPTAPAPRGWTSRYDIDPDSGCFVWNRARQNRGYGVVWFDGKVRLAHRVAWYLAHGSWPDPTKVTDHACNNKACVNPTHLRELENFENLRRAYPRGDAAAEKRRLGWRTSNAKRRNYSPSYTLGGE